MATLCNPVKLMHIEFDRLKKIPLEPLDFCKKWSKATYGEYGSRKAYITLLSQVTGLSERSIERWGSDFSQRPDYVLAILRREDMLNDIRETIGDRPDYLDQQ